MQNAVDFKTLIIRIWRKGVENASPQCNIKLQFDAFRNNEIFYLSLGFSFGISNRFFHSIFRCV